MARIFATIGLFALAMPAYAQTFSDVPKGLEEHAAVEDLHQRGIVTGRPNPKGDPLNRTFGPDDFVNRAEAVTLIVRAVANVQNLPPLSDCFPDVYREEWYVRPVCYAQDLLWVSGYPDGTFQPEQTVSKVEFLKILLGAYGIDTEPLESLRFPLATDVLDPEQWFYPFLAYGIGSSMTRSDAEGKLNPGFALTRGQVALFMHRFLLYREGQRSQALMTEAERDIRRALGHLDADAISEAGFAAGRARIMVWGVRERDPEDPLARATEILIDALGILVRTHELERIGEWETALAAAKRAYSLAEEADAVSNDVAAYTLQLRDAAHQLAENIRAAQVD